MKKKKKTPKAKIKRIKRKVTAMVKNAYYINKYYFIIWRIAGD